MYTNKEETMKNIIVVTGASSGIGREFVVQLSKIENVDEIWVIARRTNRLEELKEKIETSIKCLSLDLTNEVDLKKYIEELEKEKPNIKVLVNAAGYGKIEHDENISTDIKLNMIDLNIKAVVTITDASLPYMKENSKIVNIASDAAFQPLPYINVYAATKSFVLYYSRALNQELKYRGIKVLAVCPFWTKTEFFDRAIINKEKDVIINYTAMYETEKVVRKAIKDMNKKNKDISVYGVVNKMQWIGAKIFPHGLVMKIWMNSQKFNGTPNIR